ncbi:MAG: hypothetical protein JXB47_00640 [Anaerolineae bacterium]|nr:hypothetical protein [Anaerolineae bacterium]
MKKTAMIVLIMLAGAWVGCGLTANVKMAEYSAPVGEAQSVEVSLNLPFENMLVSPLTDAAALIEARLEYIGEIDFSAKTDGDAAVVALSEDVRSLSYTGKPLRWEIGLTPDLPLDLKVNVSAGSAELNLEKMQITGFEVNLSAGDMTASLPAMTERYDIRLGLSAGKAAFIFADGAKVNVADLTQSAGSLTFSFGAGTDIEMSVSTYSAGDLVLNLGGESAAQVNIASLSAGDITFDVPEGAAVRLEVKNAGAGTVNVPGGMAQVSGDAPQGVWETEGFERAEHKVDIVVDSMSAGRITVK